MVICVILYTCAKLPSVKVQCGVSCWHVSFETKESQQI